MPAKPFTLGRMSRNHDFKHHPDDVALYHELLRQGCQVRLMGATLLARFFLEDGQLPQGLALLPTGAQEAGAFLHTLDCFVYRVHPRYIEAFGRVVVEAMASGVPVVVSKNNIGAAEWLRHGENGFLFESNAEALEYIQALRQDSELHARIARAGRETVLANYAAGYHENLLNFLSRTHRIPAHHEKARTTPINLFIGTPAYGGMVHTDFVSTLLQFQGTGIPFALMTIDNESLITRARNTILSAFYARPEYSHLLFLDGDVFLPPNGLKRLIAHNKDVIGAPVALKGRDAGGSRIFNIGAPVGEEGTLLINERIGTAALMLSRNAVNALIDEAKTDGRVYSRAGHARGDWDADIHYDVFRTGVVNGEYLSEDYWVCRILRGLGFSIYVDPTIVTRHHGNIAT